MSNEIYPSYQMMLGGPNISRGGTEYSNDELRRMLMQVMMLQQQTGTGPRDERFVEQKAPAPPPPESPSGWDMAGDFLKTGLSTALTAVPVVGPMLAPLVNPVSDLATGESEEQILQSLLGGVSGSVGAGMNQMRQQDFQKELLTRIAGARGGKDGGFFAEMFGMPGLDMKGQASLAKEAREAGVDIPSFHDMFESGQVLVKGEDGAISAQDFVPDPAKMTDWDWSQAYIDDPEKALELFMSGLSPTREKAAARAEKPATPMSQLEKTTQALKDSGKYRKIDGEYVLDEDAPEFGGGVMPTAPNPIPRTIERLNEMSDQEFADRQELHERAKDGGFYTDSYSMTGSGRPVQAQYPDQGFMELPQQRPLYQDDPLVPGHTVPTSFHKEAGAKAALLPSSSFKERIDQLNSTKATVYGQAAEADMWAREAEAQALADAEEKKRREERERNFNAHIVPYVSPFR